MTPAWSRTTVRPEPENGWVDWELVCETLPPTAGSGGFRLDLSRGRLVDNGLRAGARPLSRASRGFEAGGEEWVGTGLVVAHSCRWSDGWRGAIGALQSLRGGLRVVSPYEGATSETFEELRATLTGDASLLPMVDGTARVGDWTRGRFSESVSEPPRSAELLVPWVPGLWRTAEFEQLGSWAQSRGFAAVIPIAVDGDPRLLRGFAERVGLSEDRSLRLFLQDGESSAVSDHRAVLAASGIRSWFERTPDHPLPQVERTRRVCGALGLLSVLGSGRRSTGWVEGHRQAARRLEMERIDVRDLLAHNNLRLLGWLDRRVRTTLTEWFALDPDLAGEPPILDRLRGEIGSSGPSPSHEPTRVADSGA